MNKVNTKADIRLNIDKVTWLDADMKEALRKSVRNRFLSGWCQLSAMSCCWSAHYQHRVRPALQEGNRFNKEGEIVVTSTRTRSQA